ncbi:hypothetical protein JDV02_009093 [Purpureocillium takamizusanense]|uniref:Major facilitator superfamily (MFS) profile domain-containing protein n=1 Tax=Purpureocillium takamizusanense TaxID=2060973 RepID=A0A9Q8QQ56_9HYPO|nr:uncharacterized protein JDV02_009093 [Purpureocillium takamizusanense]UNI23261.1 hypothetical protein JDV02_009093 [Purpureocillium takamizusanense]
MEKRQEEARISGVEDVNVKRETIRVDHEAEHKLTIREVLRHHPALVWWCFYWSMAGVGWGFDAQVNGGMLSVRSFRRDFGYYYNGEPVLPASWQSAFNTVSSVGQFFGGFLCSYIADRLGRKPALALGLVVATGGILGQVFSASNAAFLVSKLILGVGLGFYLTLGPLATSECTPVVFRAIATAGVQLGIASGQLLSNAVIKAFGEWESRWAYRGPFAIQLFFCVFLAAGLPFAPETPWHLVRVGRRDEARRSLARLYGGSDDRIEARLVTLEATVAAERAHGGRDADLSGLLECFRGTNRLRTVISTCVFLCQHLTGIIFVLGYSTYFFQLAGLPTDKSFDLGVGVTAVALFSVACSWFAINSIGRRTLFVYGIASTTVVLILIGILDVIPTGAAKWVQAALTVIYAFIYIFTLGACAFAILGEVSSATLRAPTIALATAMQAICGIVFGFVIPYMINPDQGNLRGKVGFIFGGMSACATVWSFFFVPELKGRTFDEIDQMFIERVLPRKMGSYRVETF